MNESIFPIKALGFDFDNTLANINLLHNQSWEKVLQKLDIRISKKEFFIWPVSPYEKYENQNNIFNCLFKNENIKQDSDQIIVSLTALSNELGIDWKISDKISAARLACQIKNIYLVQKIAKLFEEKKAPKIIPTEMINLLKKIKKENPSIFLFIASSTCTEAIKQILKLTKIGKYFDLVIGDDFFSQDGKNYEKSSVVASKISLELIQKEKKIKPSEIFYVGDDELRDSLFIRNIGGNFIKFGERPSFLKNMLHAYDAASLSKLFSDLRKFSLRNEESFFDAPSYIHVSLSIDKKRVVIFPKTINQNFLSSIHADFSDGTQMQNWVIDSIDVIQQLAKENTNFFLDIHIYSTNISYFYSVIQHVKKIYPNLRRCYIHTQTLIDLRDVAKFILDCPSNCEYGISINYGDDFLLDLIEKKFLEKIKGILILLPKYQESEIRFTTQAVPLVKKILCSAKFSKMELLVDRDVNPIRLSVLVKLGIRNYVIGKHIFVESDPRHTISYLDHLAKYTLSL